MIKYLAVRKAVNEIQYQKLGRPTDNPKIRRVQAKIDEDGEDILNAANYYRKTCAFTD